MIGIVPPVLPSCQLWNCVLRKADTDADENDDTK